MTRSGGSNTVSGEVVVGTLVGSAGLLAWGGIISTGEFAVQVYKHSLDSEQQVLPLQNRLHSLQAKQLQPANGSDATQLKLAHTARAVNHQIQNTKATITQAPKFPADIINNTPHGTVIAAEVGAGLVAVGVVVAVSAFVAESLKGFLERRQGA